MLAKTSHFRILSLRSYYAKGCADGLIPRCHLASRLRVSGHIRGPQCEETLRTRLYLRTNLPNSHSEIPESRESLSGPDVRGFFFRGNPG